MNEANEFSVLTDEDLAILARNLSRSESTIVADRSDYGAMFALTAEMERDRYFGARRSHYRQAFEPVLRSTNP